MQTINDYFYVWKWAYNTSFANSHNYGALSILLRSILSNSLVMGNIKLCPSLSNLTSSSSFNNHFWSGMDLYFHQHYGHKILNPIYEDMSLFVADETYRTVNVPVDGNNIGFNLLTLYGNKWDVLIKGLGILEYIDNDWKYKPLENYNRHEEIDIETEHTGTQKQEIDQTTEEQGKVTTTPTGKYQDKTSGVEANNGSSSEHFMKGFNSGSFGNEGVEKNVTKAKIEQTTERDYTTGSYKEEVKYGGSDADARKTITQTGADGNVRTDNLKDSVDHDGHLYGNIGITTSQSMAMEEIQLRNIIIYDTICKDIADYLCLPIY